MNNSFIAQRSSSILQTNLNFWRRIITELNFHACVECVRAALTAKRSPPNLHSSPLEPTISPRELSLIPERMLNRSSCPSTLASRFSLPTHSRFWTERESAVMDIAVKEGRETRPNLKVGICGEHGGEPSSIEWCHKIGLNYVSCSAFRIPVARLAAAHAAINNK